MEHRSEELSPRSFAKKAPRSTMVVGDIYTESYPNGWNVQNAARKNAMHTVASYLRGVSGGNARGPRRDERRGT
jgi:hypothetical protein